MIIKIYSSRDENIPFFSIDYEHQNDRKSLMKIAALPLQFVLNELCIQQLLSFFNTSQAVRSHMLKNQFDPKTYDASDAEKNNINTESLDKAYPDTPSPIICVDLTTILASCNHGIEIIFEAETPKIIVPENSSSKVF